MRTIDPHFIEVADHRRDCLCEKCQRAEKSRVFAAQMNWLVATTCIGVFVIALIIQANGPAL